MRSGLLAILFIAALVLVLFMQFGNLNKQHLVVGIRSSETEAVDLAKDLRSGKYESEVYLNKNGVYVITLGEFPAEEIDKVKEDAIRKGYATIDSKGNDGSNFKTRVWPEENKEVFLVAYESPVEERAVERARQLRRDYSNSVVYQKDDGSYAVTIGKYPEDQAKLLQEKFSESSYTTDGKDLTTLIFPRPEDNYYVVVKRFRNKSEGVEFTQELRNTTSYNAELYFTRIGEYVTTIGYAGESQAKRLRARALESGIADRDAYLAIEEDLGGKVDLATEKLVKFDDEEDPDEDGDDSDDNPRPIVRAPRDIHPGNPRPIEERTGAAPQRDPELLNPDLLNDTPPATNRPTSTTPVSSKPVIREKPVTRNSNLYIVAMTSSSLEEALQMAKIYREEGFEGQVFSTNSGKYSVTIGHYSKARAERMRDLAIASGSAKSDAFLASGQNFKGLVYP
ncbi:MAG: hypothetical protein AAFP70_00835 [Calditrichota bacterium]